MSTPSALPPVIGKYSIEGLLDKGGMSLLYLGVNKETNIPAIVKVLSPKFLPCKEVLYRFQNEAKIIALADHPNIVKLYDFGEWENGLYIAIEFVKGVSLRKILSHQPFSLRKALEVILQTAYALCHLHTHGIIHGDIKPENILITDDDKVKLIDFGIAKMFESQEEEEKDLSNKFIGTPAYMSPEAKRGLNALTFQSDIYSLAIMAYELMLGKITHGKVILSLAPKGMGRILSKALQANPEDRYQDIVDFITDISNYMNSSEVERDRQGSDYFFELYEQLEQFQEEILPKEPPQWENIDIGKGDIHGIGLESKLYYEFFTLEKEKAIVASEVGGKGGVGILSSATIRAIVRTLFSQKHASHEKLFQTLLERISTDLFGEQFSLFVLFLNDATYESFSYGKSALVINPQGLKGKIKKNDSLSICCFPEKEKEIETIFHSISAKIQDMSAQQKTDALLRKIRMNGSPLIEEAPLVLINLLFR